MKRPQSTALPAKAGAFLVSPDAVNITGQCRYVYGDIFVRD
jgi:hypothetical protein